MRAALDDFTLVEHQDLVGGCSDVALLQVCRRQAEAGAPSLWEFLRQEEQGSQFAFILGVLADLHIGAGKQRTADLLHSFLNQTDYRAALRLAGESRALRNVQKLVLTAQNSGLVDVADFLAYVDNVRSGAIREGEAVATAENAVQIMSVHQSKGLEFAVVALGDAAYTGPIRRDVILDPEFGILPPVTDEEGRRMALFERAFAIDRDKEEAESDRLLYVACTRARDKLLINGHLSITKSGRPSLRGWLRQVGDVVGLTTKTIEIETGHSEQVEVALTLAGAPVGCTIYTEAFDPPQQFPVVEFSAEHPDEIIAPLIGPIGPSSEERLVEVDEETLREAIFRHSRDGARSTVMGTIVHEAVAAWRLPHSSHDPDFMGWAIARAGELGLLPQTRSEAVAQQARRLLHRLRLDPLGRHIATADARLHEVPYTFLDGGVLILRRIDLLCRHDNRWTLLELKTDRLRNDAELRGAIKRYRGQLAGYVAAVKQLLEITAHGHLVFLDAPDGIHIFPRLDDSLTP